MLAFITGASSGIGRDMAKVLASKGYDLILTARDEEKLIRVRTDIMNELSKREMKDNLTDIANIEKNKINIRVIIADLEKEEEVLSLYEKIKNENIDIFINNAGFGTIGNFWETNLNKEINMLKVNDLAMHILFKLILKDMLKKEVELEKNNTKKSKAQIKEKNTNESSNCLIKEKNTNESSNCLIKEKYILNVSSLSGYMPGPKMSAYYATKAYMLNLTKGVYKELKMAKSKINLSVLCPGPICTNFCDRAGVNFKTKYLTSEYTAEYAINKLFKKKLVIIPGFLNKCGHVLAKITPSKLVMAVIYRMQEKSKNM